MPVIDLGRVIGPQGPQGATGPQGARGTQGLPGPNQIASNTATPLNGVLVGDGNAVGVRSIDTEPTANSTGFVTSGAVKEAIDENQAQLATVESGNTASRAYAVGELFCWNGLLYRAISAISRNGAFTPGTNCEQTNIEAELLTKPKNMVFTLMAGKTLTITKTANSLYSYLIGGAGPAAFGSLWWVMGYSNTGTQTKLVTLSSENGLVITNAATYITVQNAHSTSGARATVLVLAYEGTPATYTVD